MKLKKEEFRKKLADGKLVLSLIGMSNVGKSFWGKNLKKAGFRHFCCDDLIEERLGPELAEKKYKGIADVAKWMGQPYEERFLQNQKIYLDHETYVLKQIFDEVGRGIMENVLIDTTGSVIYTGDEIFHRLKELSLVIYIQATEEMKEAMFKKYMECPKPVIWGNLFERMNEESQRDALARCYPALLNYRSDHYEQIADIVIPRKFVPKEKVDLMDFLESIEKECE